MSPRIVVIQPQEGPRQRVCDALSGYSVTPFEQPRQALAAIDLEPPDLVVTAMFMDDVDGLEVVDTLGALYEELPVVVVDRANASVGTVDYLEVALSLGAAATVGDSFDADAIRTAVTKALSR